MGLDRSRVDDGHARSCGRGPGHVPDDSHRLWPFAGEARPPGNTVGASRPARAANAARPGGSLLAGRDRGRADRDGLGRDDCDVRGVDRGRGRDLARCFGRGPGCGGRPRARPPGTARAPTDSLRLRCRGIACRACPASRPDDALAVLRDLRPILAVDRHRTCLHRRRPGRALPTSGEAGAG